MPDVWMPVTDPDWKAFGDEVMTFAEKHAGLHELSAVVGIPYQRLWRIRKGQEPKAGDFLKLAQLMRGRVLWP